MRELIIMGNGYCWWTHHPEKFITKNGKTIIKDPDAIYDIRWVRKFDGQKIKMGELKKIIMSANNEGYAYDKPTTSR